MENFDGDERTLQLGSKPRFRLDDQFFMNFASQVARASTCVKIQVGAVLVRDTRVLSMGYNGTASGQSHCYEHFSDDLSRESLGEEEFLKQHRVFSEEHEFHAESNVLTFAWKNLIDTSGTTLYCTHCPCFSCAKLIVQAKVARVIYSQPYDPKTLQFLKEHGVLVEQIL